jgi:hypothetical protein
MVKPEELTAIKAGTLTTAKEVTQTMETLFKLSKGVNELAGFNLSKAQQQQLVGIAGTLDEVYDRIGKLKAGITQEQTAPKQDQTASKKI